MVFALHFERAGYLPSLRAVETNVIAEMVEGEHTVQLAHVLDLLDRVLVEI